MASTLCLTCSSSLPPRSGQVFTTPCCGRPICPTCLKSNPRLARYDPCLACLGGMDAVASSRTQRNPPDGPRNVNGAARDEDTYVIGDDDEDPDSDCGNDDRRNTPPPVYQAQEHLEGASIVHTASIIDSLYHIKHSDTLQGIAFKLRMDAHELCRLNKLPPSTINTTPHLLHTRTSLVIPVATRTTTAKPPNEVKEAERWQRECAAKRLQLLTKELDWHTAKAYVALADDPELVAQQASKAKEIGENINASLEGLAVAQYLDDDEWEQTDRQARASTSKQPSGSSRGWWRHSKG
ncbi:hypothetical protein BDN71DRAFT_1445684 [Pleurotus eryngii]|uniref:LysM domain-containing protein n=1 Tax=Pleurotus eryngii TaxID=5323 RepID=A0A9P6A0E1_PLEER|nr:hypothetical protein BDN71DRAFT_1445684 [Pleurotus eryngii]